MQHSTRNIVVLFFVLVGLIYMVESNKATAIDWKETYHNQHKTPYGTYILDQEIDTLFAGKLRRTENYFYFFIENDSAKLPVPITYMNLAAEDIGRIGLHQTIKDFIAEGNTLVSFQNSFDTSGIFDSLGITFHNNSAIKEPHVVSLTSSNLPVNNFTIENTSSSYFSFKDSIAKQINVLGYKKVQDKKQPNIIEVKYGKGSYILGTDPIALTNYNMLDSNNHLYIEGFLSLLPQQTTYFKVQVIDDNSPISSPSILRFFLDNDALRWAWYFTIFTLFVFVFFSAKRKQRIIPIIPTLKNTTIAYIKTLASIYIEQKDYMGMIEKGIIYNLDKIRSQYLLNTSDLNEEFIEQLATKSNKDKADVEHYINFIKNFRNNRKAYNTEEALILYNQLSEHILD